MLLLLQTKVHHTAELRITCHSVQTGMDATSAVMQCAHRKVVCSSAWLALHEAVHDVEELLNTLINAQLLSALHYPLILPAYPLIHT